MKTATAQWNLLILIHWIVIFPVVDAIHLLNNQDQELGISPAIAILASVFQKMDSAIHWINPYPVDNAIGSDFSGG